MACFFWWQTYTLLVQLSQSEYIQPTSLLKIKNEASKDFSQPWTHFDLIISEITAQVCCLTNQTTAVYVTNSIRQADTTEVYILHWLQSLYKATILHSWCFGRKVHHQLPIFFPAIWLSKYRNTKLGVCCRHPSQDSTITSAFVHCSCGYCCHLQLIVFSWQCTLDTANLIPMYED